MADECRATAPSWVRAGAGRLVRVRAGRGSSPPVAVADANSGPASSSLEGEADDVEELLILGRRNLGVPITSGAPPTPGEAADQQGIEDVSGRRVEQDVRHVLAADQVHVVNPQIHRRDFVPAATYRTLPLHDLWSTSTETIASGQECLPVEPGRVELGVVGAAGPDGIEEIPVVGRQAAHHGRACGQHLVEVVASEHPEARAELGHHGAQIWHVRILPRWLRAFAHRTRAREGRYIS